MKKIYLMIGFCAILALLACGCTTPAQTPATPPPTPVPTAAPTIVQPPPVFFGKWILTTMAIQEGTVPLQPTTEITLVFNADGSLTGYGGCNNYFGTYTLTGTMTKFGDGISIGPLASTKKYCEINGQQETIYVSILQKTAAYSINIKQLTLTDTSLNVLVFKVPSALPTTVLYFHPA
jgi:heat shock protein HslJ